jgi:hypothetical protein
MESDSNRGDVEVDITERVGEANAELRARTRDLEGLPECGVEEYRARRVEGCRG